MGKTSSDKSLYLYLGEFDFPQWFSLFYQSVKISFSCQKCQCKNKFYFYRESDRDVVAAASSIFIVSSVKVAAQTTELIKSELHHQLPDQRINALLRFQVRFKFEYTVGGRLQMTSPPRGGGGSAKR